MLKIQITIVLFWRGGGEKNLLKINFMWFIALILIVFCVVGKSSLRCAVFFRTNKTNAIIFWSFRKTSESLEEGMHQDNWVQGVKINTKKNMQFFWIRFCRLRKFEVKMGWFLNTLTGTRLWLLYFWNCNLQFASLKFHYLRLPFNFKLINKKKKVKRLYVKIKALPLKSAIFFFFVETRISFFPEEKKSDKKPLLIGKKT